MRFAQARLVYHPQPPREDARERRGEESEEAGGEQDREVLSHLFYRALLKASVPYKYCRTEIKVNKLNSQAGQRRKPMAVSKRSGSVKSSVYRGPNCNQPVPINNRMGRLIHRRVTRRITPWSR